MTTIDPDYALIIELAQRAVRRCELLATISELDDGVLRRYLTSEHKQCNQQVAKWMQAEGMHTWQDEVGNQWGRIASTNPEAKRLIVGSHLDTVPNAGAFDGILGVMLGIELAALTKHHSLSLPFHLDVVGFCDEEGTRFATTLIGSKAIAGDFKSQWLRIEDADGISMAQAMRDFGLEINNTQHAGIEAKDLLGYLEVHIEQGPLLESLNQPIGVVSAIAGAKRAEITFRGKAGHAGTTPMHLRHDALCAAAEFILNVEQLAGECNNHQVATVGQSQAFPGATNVIPGESKLSIDIRAQNDNELGQLVERLQNSASDICSKRGVSHTWQWTHEAESVSCDENIIAHLLEAANQCGVDAPILPSGAGHDAMAVAAICPVGMLFIRSPGGISHHPGESVMEMDVAKALSTVFVTTQRLSS